MKKLLLIAGIWLTVMAACGTPEPGTGNPNDSASINSSGRDTTAGTTTDTSRNQQQQP